MVCSHRKTKNRGIPVLCSVCARQPRAAATGAGLFCWAKGVGPSVDDPIYDQAPLFESELQDWNLIYVDHCNTATRRPRGADPAAAQAPTSTPWHVLVRLARLRSACKSWFKPLCTCILTPSLAVWHTPPLTGRWAPRGA